MVVDNRLCVSGALLSWKSTNHIDVRYQFEAVENLTDLLTKVVTMIKFNHCLDLINITKV